MEPDWVDPAWRVEADSWAEARLEELGLERTGAIEQPHVRPWSTVLRIPTDAGDVWFKANMPGLEHEARLVALLARKRPDCIPPLLAHDPETRLDADGRRRRAAARSRRGRARPDALARHPVALRRRPGRPHGDADDARRARRPRHPPRDAPCQAEELLDEVAGLEPETRARLVAALPEIRELCDELDSFGIPATIQHDDLHDGQVYVRDGEYVLLDWGDACISHPFFTLAVTLDGVIAWGVDDVEHSEPTEPYQDAYLRSFAAVHGEDDLVAACTIARRLGWVCRAVNGYLAPFETEQTGRRLRMFLDGSP